jgi:hypothetical protein
MADAATPNKCNRTMSRKEMRQGFVVVLSFFLVSRMVMKKQRIMTMQQETQMRRLKSKIKTRM